MALNYTPAYNYSSVNGPAYAGGIGQTVPGANTTLVSGQQAYVPAAQPSGSVLGASTGPSSSGSGAPAPDSELTQLQKVQQSGGLNPSQQSRYNELMFQANQLAQPAPVQAPIDYESIFAPLMQNVAENNPIIQSAYDQNVGNINASRQTRLGENAQGVAAQSATLNEAKGAQDVAAQNAQDEARRQFAEISQGLQARYGGTTGTGAFANELAGRQTLQNLAQTRQAHSQAILQLDNKLQQVQAVGALAVQDIEDKTKASLDQAKQQLDAQLQSVRDRQGELMSQKAQMAAQAIRDYQQQVNNVNAQNAAFKQNLFMQQTAAENQLKAIQEQIQGRLAGYQQQGQGLVNNLPATLNGYNIGYQQTPVGGQNLSFPAQGAANLTGGAGSIENFKKEQQQGTGSGGLYDYLRNSLFQ